MEKENLDIERWDPMVNGSSNRTSDSIDSDIQLSLVILHAVTG